MEMSTGHFVGAFVLFILMLSTTQAFPRNKEDSSNGNSSTDESDFKELRCLFVDNKLPICGSKWWSNSNEDPANDQTKSDFESNVGKNNLLRKRSIVEITANTRIVVYAFKDCLLMEPDRLRFLMPFCEDVIQPRDFDQIVRVELFEPFVIEDVKEPPYIFPGRPKRPRANRRRRIPAGNDQGRANDPARPSKETTPIVADRTVSSSNRLVPRSRTKPAETMDTVGQTIVSSTERKSSAASASVENTIRRTSAEQNRRRAESRGFGLKFFDAADRRWKMIVVDRRRRILAEQEVPLAALAIPTAPTTPAASNLPSKLTGKFVLGKSNNQPANRGNSNDFLKPVARSEENDINGIATEPNDPPTLPEIIAINSRRMREAKVNGH